MFGFIVRRLLQIIPTVFIAISFLFFLFFVLPGDPATLIVGGGNRTVDPGVIERAQGALRARRSAVGAVQGLLGAPAALGPR